MWMTILLWAGGIIGGLGLLAGILRLCGGWWLVESLGECVGDAIECIGDGIDDLGDGFGGDD